MSSEDSKVSTPVTPVPDIVITEPSLLIVNASVTNVPIEENTVPTQEVCVRDDEMSPEDVLKKLPEQIASSITQPKQIATPPEQIASSITQPKQIASFPDAENMADSEFYPAENCNDCVVPIAEAILESEPVDPMTESSELDADEFRTYRCCRVNFGCQGPYNYLWSVLKSRYSLPFWLVLMALPLSAGVMGAIYMFSCPAAASLPNMLFMMGISLMAVLSLRVCIITHRLTWEDGNSRSKLQTMNLICIFLSTLFYVTESVTYWQMSSSPQRGTQEYCHPTFSTFSFWWNIGASVLMAVILVFPVA